jgi:hypothetical protein
MSIGLVVIFLTGGAAILQEHCKKHKRPMKLESDLSDSTSVSLISRLQLAHQTLGSRVASEIVRVTRRSLNCFDVE